MPASSALRRSVQAVGRNPRLLRVEAAYALFTTYEMGVWVALLFWAYDVGGESLAGVVAVALLLPAAALAPVGGWLGDRWPRDRALLAVYLLQAVTMLGLSAALASGGRATVIGCAALALTAFGWTRPSHYGAATELSTTPQEAAAANALSGTILGVGYFVGPILAGVLTAWGGPGVAVLGGAVLALGGAGCVLGLGLQRPLPHPADGAEPGHEMVGMRALAAYPDALALLLLLGVGFLVEGCLNLLAVTFASQQLDLGPAAAGLLIGALGAGSVLGAALSVVLTVWRRLSWAVAGGILAAGLPLVVMPLLTQVPAAVTASFLTGAGQGFFAVGGITLLQRAVRPGVMARVLALRESALLGGYAAGAALAPLLVAEFGAGDAYAAVGLGLVVLALASLPLLRRLDRRSEYNPELVALLRGVPFLSVLGARALEGLSQGAQELSVAAGRAVVRQGEQGDRYYLVAEGRLDITVANSAMRVPRVRGDGFGEIALLHDVPRTATVTAIEPCRLWAVDRTTFLTNLAGSAGAELASRHVEAILRELPSSDPPAQAG
jgi:CRP-like cAMP-binding protein